MDDLNSIWNHAPVRAKTDIPDDPQTDPTVPDGEYEAEILNFSCFLSKRGAWWMKWVMAIRGGLLDGRILVRFVEVKANTAPYLKNDVFLSLGREAQFAGELADVTSGRSGPACSEMVGAVVLARLRTRMANDGSGREFKDVYINGTVQVSAASFAKSPGSPGAPEAPGFEEFPAAASGPAPAPWTPADETDEVPF
jgi:hypothetical protein